jgi:hypothetical protein
MSDRVALCFMLTEHSKQCKYWSKWRGKHSIPIFYHCDKCETISCGSDCFFNCAVKVKSHATSWGDTRLAEQELYAAALKLKTVTTIALVSETCVPIYTFLHTTRIMEAMTRSQFAWDHVGRSWYRCDTHKIMKRDLAKTWIELSQADPTFAQKESHELARMRLNSQKRARNADCILDDVVVFGRLVSVLGAKNLQAHIYNHSPTFCVFDARGFRNIVLDLQELGTGMLRKAPWLFVRKVIDELPFNMPLSISQTGKERFQNIAENIV